MLPQRSIAEKQNWAIKRHSLMQWNLCQMTSVRSTKATAKKCCLACIAFFLYAFILFDLGFCFWRKLCYSTRTTTMLGQRPTCKVQKHFGCQQAVCRHYKGQVPSKVDGKACCESAICSVEGICADGCFVRDHHKGMGFQTVVSRLYCELY